jgi:hypothetical protein
MKSIKLLSKGNKQDQFFFPIALLICMVMIFSLINFGCKPGSFSQKSKNPDMGKPYTGLVKLSFVHVQSKEYIPFNYINTVTLIHFKRESQDKGVEIKRWTGDKIGQYKYVELDRRELKLSDFVEGKIILESGIYQIKHNSVYGQPPSGYYGKSDYFEIKAGDDLIKVKITLNPAI